MASPIQEPAKHLEEGHAPGGAGGPGGHRCRWRGRVFNVLLGVWLTLAAGFWAMVLTANWGSDDQVFSVVVAWLYVGNRVGVLLGLYLPGHEGARATLRRALVMVPVGVAGWVLIVGLALALDELSMQIRASTLGDFPEVIVQPVVVLGGGVLLGAALIGATGRVPLGRLFARGWLALTISAVVVSIVAIDAVCAAPPGFMSGLKGVISLAAALGVLSWAVAFGLAVGATRDWNAAPPGGPDLAEPPRAER